jgi:hypothetical protein
MSDRQIRKWAWGAGIGLILLLLLLRSCTV